MGSKLDDDMVRDALGDLDHSRLPGPTVAALRLADVLTSESPVVTPEFQSELLEHFTETQVLELGSALAVASGWQTFIEAFGIRPDNWTPEMPEPERPGD